MIAVGGCLCMDLGPGSIISGPAGRVASGDGCGLWGDKPMEREQSIRRKGGFSLSPGPKLPMSAAPEEVLACR
jgi:hypothetical protein